MGSTIVCNTETYNESVNKDFILLLLELMCIKLNFDFII